MKFTCLALTCIAVLFLSCGNNAGDGRRAVVGNETSGNDSLKIYELLKHVYQWHDARQNDLGFDVVVKDSFQVGLDTAKLGAYIDELRKTGFFTAGFLDNFRRLVQRTDYKLRNDTTKYYNEINFAFQDADLWNFFQDEFGNYWDSLKVHDLKVNADTASLVWTVGNEPIKEGYRVKCKRESNGWKIAYLQGFDSTSGW